MCLCCGYVRCERESVSDYCYYSTLITPVPIQSPKAYKETSHALGSLVNPGRPVFAGSMLGGEVPSGLHLPGTNSDRLHGPTVVADGGAVTRDSVWPVQREASPAPPPPPQTSAFPVHGAGDLATPQHNGHMG